MKLAALHLKHMLETGEDMEKTLVTVQARGDRGIRPRVAGIAGPQVA